MDRPLVAASLRTRAKRPGAIGWSGVALVLGLIAIRALNVTADMMKTRPLRDWPATFVEELLLHAFIGVAILLAALSVRCWVPYRGPRQLAAAVIAVAVATGLAMFMLYTMGESPLFGDPWPWATRKIVHFAAETFRYALVGAIITSAWLYLCAEAEDAEVAKQLAIDTERMDRETAEARLQMLEAQIEPHFLFNTLAHVRRLYETDRDAGVHMLRSLKDYLSVSLPQMREGAATLGREIDHVAAYLAIHQMRMGRRLAYAIDVPDRLHDARLPSLMVLTLVENAVKHGLTSLPEGGRIDVRATLPGGRLRIDVVDNGRGFSKSQGSGTGLANIGARLASTYGSSATLSLAINPAGGITATIELPFEPARPPVAPS
jgi:signal transduction histidine kinase